MKTLAHSVCLSTSLKTSRKHFPNGPWQTGGTKVLVPGVTVQSSTNNNNKKNTHDHSSRDFQSAWVACNLTSGPETWSQSKNNELCKCTSSCPSTIHWRKHVCSVPKFSTSFAMPWPFLEPLRKEKKWKQHERAEMQMSMEDGIPIQIAFCGPPGHFQLSPDAGRSNEKPLVFEAFFSHHCYQAIIIDGGLYMYQNGFTRVPSIWIISCVKVTMSVRTVYNKSQQREIWHWEHKLYECWLENLSLYQDSFPTLQNRILSGEILAFGKKLPCVKISLLTLSDLKVSYLVLKNVFHI